MDQPSQLKVLVAKLQKDSHHCFAFMLRCQVGTMIKLFFLAVPATSLAADINRDVHHVEANWYKLLRHCLEAKFRFELFFGSVKRFCFSDFQVSVEARPHVLNGKLHRKEAVGCGIFTNSLWFCPSYLFFKFKILTNYVDKL